MAVSDYDGTATLYLHAATNTGATSFVRPGRSAWRTIRVPCMPLERVLESHGVGTVDLLKIDIEGAEYEAVLGSPALFNAGRVRALIVEYHPDILRRRGRRASDIHESLLGAGFTLDALNTIPQPGSVAGQVIYSWTRHTH
jgi:hypothetical protein